MDKILSLLKEFDIANFLPEMEGFLSQLRTWAGLIMMAGPLIMLGLGLWYYFAPPEEANHSAGFRTYWGMGSVEVWRYTQRLAGMCYMVLGGALTLIMLIICLFFGGMAATKVMTTVFVCVIIQLVLVLAAWIGIQVLVFRAFDKEGNRRK